MLLLAVSLLLRHAQASAMAGVNRPEMPCVSVKDSGALGDGQTDDTLAFRAAIAAAGVGNRTCVLVPPVGAGQGYVLTDTVVIPSVLKLIGELAGMLDVQAVFKPPDSSIVGAKIFARPILPDPTNASAPRPPLFRLTSGCVVRGLWIFYDTQPMPPDSAFTDPSSPYFYETFAAARTNFMHDHVHRFGPTFYVSGARVILEDLIGDRFTDFIFFSKGGGGECSVRRIQAYLPRGMNA